MNYRRTTTIPEALKYLEESRGTGLLIAGGTDVFPGLKSGKLTADVLIDITSILGAKKIEKENGRLVIGCAATLSEIIKSPLVRIHAPLLVNAAGKIGSVQIRNIATLPGNVVTANPEADAAIALSVMEALFCLEGINGNRTVSFEEMYNISGGSVVKGTSEIVTKVFIPFQNDDEVSTFQRIALRKAMSPAILNVGFMVKPQGEKVEWARISMGPVAPAVRRASKAETWLIGKTLSSDNIRHAAELALDDANPVGNPFRGSHEYLLQVLSVLIERGLSEIAQAISARLNNKEPEVSES